MDLQDIFSLVMECAGESKDTQLFVEPMQWMEEVVAGHVQGKLHCPG